MYILSIRERRRIFFFHYIDFQLLKWRRIESSGANNENRAVWTRRSKNQSNTSMKKIFTLFSMLCLLGIFTSNAQMSWNLEFRINPDSNLENSTNIWESFTVEYIEGPGEKESIGLSSNEFAVTTESEQTANVYLTSSDYSVMGISYGSSTGTVNGSEPSWNFQLNPMMTGVTVYINVVPAGSSDPNKETYTVDVSYSGDLADSVESLSFKGQLQSDTDAIIFEFDKSNTSSSNTTEGNVTIGFKESDLESSDVEVKVTYTTTDSQVPVEIENVQYANNQISFQLDVAVAVTLSIYVNEKEPTTPEYAVTFYLSGNFSLAKDDQDQLTEQYYDYFNVLVDGEEYTLEGNSFTIPYSDDEVNVVVAPISGYTLTYRPYPTDFSGITSEEDGSIVVNIDFQSLTSNVSIDVEVAKLPEVSVKVEIDVTNYPGLISSLRWGSVTTDVTEDSDLEGYEVSFAASQAEGNLTINFSVDEEDNPLYVVTSMTVNVTDANGQVTDGVGSLTADGLSANVTIPADAESVAISFVATENDTEGIDSLGVSGEGSVIYNLQGQKVANPSNGIFIVNGKKVVIR